MCFEGSLEYSEWSSVRDSNRTELKSLVEPSTNYMTSHHVKGPRRSTRSFFSDFVLFVEGMPLNSAF